jgi:uncharacterized protein (TIGR00369 family)
MAETMPFTLLPPERGRVTLRALPEPRFFNLTRSMHGGWIMTLLDTVMALSAHTLLAPGQAVPTHETSVKFVRPITMDSGELTARGRVIAQGRTLVTLDGEISDAAGRVCAHGTSTCVIVAMA